MDYDDLLDGLVPDLERAVNDLDESDADALDPNADLPTELVLVEDGEPQPEAIARLDYLRDYAVMVYGTAVVEVVEKDEEEGTVRVRLLSPTSVSISADTDDEVRVDTDGREIEEPVLDTHSGEQDHYGTSPVEQAAEADLLDSMDLTGLMEDRYGEQ